ECEQVSHVLRAGALRLHPTTGLLEAQLGVEQQMEGVLDGGDARRLEAAALQVDRVHADEARAVARYAGERRDVLRGPSTACADSTQWSPMRQSCATCTPFMIRLWSPIFVSAPHSGRPTCSEACSRIRLSAPITSSPAMPSKPRVCGG